MPSCQGIEESVGTDRSWSMNTIFDGSAWSMVVVGSSESSEGSSRPGVVEYGGSRMSGATRRR